MNRLALCLTLLVSACGAQSFEVASIRVNDRGDGNSNYSVSGREGSHLAADNVTLISLLLRAFAVHEYQISGPDWLKDVRVDINARLPDSAPREQMAAALQLLLKDRFKLTFHRETKEATTYALVVGKGGSKLQPAADESGKYGTWVSRGQFKAQNETLDRFCDVLSRNLDRPVVDMTGLSGKFDFVLDYTPNDPKVLDPAGAPSIFTAVQEQLGLKLESRKGPMEMFVIDRIEKTPTEN
jgi:uncharacterized protein (TIGR03435 family)